MDNSNQVNPVPSQALARLRRQLSHHIWLSRLLIVVSVVILIVVVSILASKPLQQLFSKIILGPKAVTTFFSDPLYTLPSYNGHTNILFLGMGGGNHDGAQLTDTIIFGSLNLKTTNVSMVSIPRDVWVPSLESKINAAYAIGEQQATGSGTLLAKDAVFEVVGEPIHYVVTLDFNGFEQLIDIMGGIDVKIDQDFTDTKYPIAGLENADCGFDPEYRCRYETVSFKAGLHHLDGKAALKYSRSRHAEGDEGTDFARSIRQQKVIYAMKDKLLSASVLLNPKKIQELKALLFQYMKVDRSITDNEYAAFAGFGFNFWRQNKEIQTLTLETGDEDNPGFLVNPPLEKYDQWVLEPRSGDWSEFQAYLKQKIN